MLVPFCTSYVALCSILLLLGFSAGLYLPSAMSTISLSMPEGYLTRGMSVHELAPNLGFVSAPILWVLVEPFLVWKYWLFFIGIALIFLGFLYLKSPYSSNNHGVCPDFSLISHLIRLPKYWLLVVLFSLGICSTLGIYSILPLYLVENHGMETDKANYIVSISRVFSIAAPLVGGVLGDKIGNMRVLTGVLIIGGCCTVGIGIANNTLLLSLIVVQAIVSVCFFPSGFALLSTLEVNGKRDVAIPFCIPGAFVIGGGILPMVIGIIGDTLSLGVGIFVVGGLITCGGLLLQLLNYWNK